MLAGFPPRPLALNGNDRSSISLGGLLRPNEVVTVREHTEGEATVLHGQGTMKQKKSEAGVTSSSSSSTAGGRRGKTKKSGTPHAISVNAGPNVRTLHGDSGRGGSGGRGGGGGAPRKRRRMHVGVSSEEDIGGLLLSSVGGGTTGGRVGQCMRAVFRKAMDKQFDEVKANARVGAAEGGRYVLEENTEARRGDGSCARLKVTYHKGLGFQSNFEDDVELLTKAQLLGVIGSVLVDNDAREMLKPGGMAGCSPRVFWSLLFHCGGPKTGAGGAGEVEAALRRLLPEQDWGFLHTRHSRKLSEKAMENQAQEEESRRERQEVARQTRERREARLARKKTRESSGAAAVAAATKTPPTPTPTPTTTTTTRTRTTTIIAVEGDGVEERKKNKKKEGDTTATATTSDGKEEEEEEEVAVVVADERELRAQAALARFSKGGGGGGGGIVVGGGGVGGEQGGREKSARAEAAGSSSTKEEDEDEDGDEVDSDFPEEVSDAWVRVLRSRSFKLLTCAALAGADAEELTPRLEEHLLRKAKPAAPSKPTVEEVQKWVTACQSDEMDSMMMSLANGDEDLLEALERVHVATPKDLRLWAGSVPGALLDMLEQEVELMTDTDDDDDRRLKAKARECLPDLETVREMGRKAEEMMLEHAWLDLWGSE